MLQVFMQSTSLFKSMQALGEFIYSTDRICLLKEGSNPLVAYRS
jgi:hypothetical protein